MDQFPIVPFGFLLLVILIITLVYKLQSKSSAKKSVPGESHDDTLHATDILQWEFEYIRTTASEAMRDRHTMVNYYLLAVGIVASGVIAVIKHDSGLPAKVGAVLLWGLCIIGMFYFLKIIRLRQAWHDSATAMNKIKKAFILNTGDKGKELLESAFHWSADSLPALNKRWTVFHYSALLIGFIGSVAYFAGSVLLYLEKSGKLTHLPLTSYQWIFLILFGLCFFGVHFYTYHIFLKTET